MTPEQALKVCLDTLEKIAETNGTVESSSLMDWRRKVKIMAEKAHAQASRAAHHAAAGTPHIPQPQPSRRD